VYIIIIGAGEVGYNLARMLSWEKQDIVLIEKDPERIKRAQEHIDARFIRGIGTEFTTLEEAGIKEADLLVAVTDNDEVNLISCMVAHHYGVEKKIARVKNKQFINKNSPLNETNCKIDMIIHPDSVAAKAVVNLLHQTAATDILEFADGNIATIGIQLDRECEIIDMSMQELASKYAHLEFRIVAIQRRDRTLIPTGQDIILGGDRIFITAKKENVDDIVKLAGKENAKIENVMILGGGQTGAEIARLLEKDLNVKIIESNADKSNLLAESLQKSLVIKGDGRDLNLLAVEGIIDMDAFISATGDDETNIISSLMAKHLEVPRIISLINKTDYTPIIPTIGIDAYVSKQLITVDNILKFIRSDSIVSIASIPGSSAEIIEYLTTDKSKITKKTVKNLNIPRGAILGAVYREDEFIIPVGDTQIRSNDKVIVFSLPSAFRDVEKMFN